MKGEMRIPSILAVPVFLLLTAAMNELKAQEAVEGIHYATGQPVRVEFSGSKIKSIKKIKKLSGPARVYLAPGFFDNQVNGFAGISFSFGNSDLRPDDILKATRELWKKGVTSYLPTLTTHSHEVLMKNFKVLGQTYSGDSLLGSIPGFHLEGPYINPEDGYRGAHPKAFVRLPDWDEFMKLYHASGKKILQVTLAPELDGAMDFIKKCKELGVTVAIGHHNANRSQVDEAVKYGARIVTHLGNGCANTINRHINPLWPQLSNDGLMISIICDGFHLNEEEIRVFYKVKGPGMTVITSDVTSYAALEPGEYKTQTGETIELTREGMLRYPAQNVMYGSASPITKGVGHIMKATGCSLSEAVQMASTNPAQLYGLTDRGKLEKGLRGDLVLFTLEDFNITIQKTYVQGIRVYDRNHP